MSKSHVGSVRPRRSTRSVILCGVATLVLCGLDLGSKAWASDHLSEPAASPVPVCESREYGLALPQRQATERVSVIDEHLELHYTENCGAAFGLLRNAPPILRQLVLGGAALGASLVLFLLLIRGRGSWAFAAAVPFIVAGALGNLIDRVRLGYVVDFIRLYWSEPIVFLGTAWPTINVADMTITIGVGLLLLDAHKMAQAESNPGISENVVGA